jgi:DNA-binding GntR family transcriptional regulator
MIIRQLANRLHSLMIERRSAARHQFSVPVTITILSEENRNAKLLKQKNYATSGFTRDLSDVGIAFYVGVIRLNEFYLVGEERPLIAKLTLPEGEVEMKIVGVRYEQENRSLIELKYLIGARIVEMNQAHREIYQRFLQQKKDCKQKEIVQNFSAEKLEN